MLERKFQKFVKSNLIDYAIQFHPGVGSDLGIPDLFLGISSGLLPCELKLGQINDGLLCVSEVRPSQIAWHRRHANNGYDSIFLVGIQNPETKWRMFVIDGITIQAWDSHGFEIGKDAFEISVSGFKNEIEEFVEGLNA